jgi:hypothetical protein
MVALPGRWQIRVFPWGTMGERTMKKIAWSTGFVILAAVAAADSACTVTVNNGDDGGNFATDDGGNAQETSTGTDTGTQPDAGLDTGSQVDTGATADGSDSGMCPTAIDTGSAPCDQCIESLCCSQLDACATADDAGLDDAGASACARLTQCVFDWVAADAGSVSSGEASCGPAYSQTEQTQSHALITCLYGSCATLCQ